MVRDTMLNSLDIGSENDLGRMILNNPGSRSQSLHIKYLSSSIIWSVWMDYYGMGAWKKAMGRFTPHRFLVHHRFRLLFWCILCCVQLLSWSVQWCRSRLDSTQSWLSTIAPAQGCTALGRVTSVGLICSVSWLLHWSCSARSYLTTLTLTMTLMTMTSLRSFLSAAPSDSSLSIELCLLLTLQDAELFLRGGGQGHSIERLVPRQTIGIPQ